MVCLHIMEKFFTVGKAPPLVVCSAHKFINVSYPFLLEDTIDHFSVQKKISHSLYQSIFV